MAKIKTSDITVKMVEILTPLSAEERQRVIRASLTLLGDEAPDIKQGAAGRHQGGEEGGPELPPRARAWLMQNGLSFEELEQVFQIAGDVVDVIASEIPGRNDKEKTYNAYVLTGMARFLATGNPGFDDKSARTLCKSSGCFNNANHAAYMGEKGNEFTGSKSTGWTLTAPGLKRGAALIKELTKKQ